MKKTVLVLTTTLVLCTLYSVLCTGVHAQQVLPLTVIPPKQEALVNPGEHFETSVKFLNQGDTPVTGTLSVEDFIVTDNQGTPVFLDNPQVVGTTQIPEKYSAAKWITIQQTSITIASKGNVSVPISINVPKNAAPGGRYAAVLFQPGGSLTLGSPESAQEQAIAIRLASLLYLRVAGPITENATVTKFEGPGFLEYGPVSITSEITNDGDYHITPQGEVTMTDMFGRVIDKSTLEAKNIFPGTAREYSNQLGGKVMFGKFTINLLANYGDQGQLLTSSMTMWIFPWRVALAIFLGVVIVVLIITLWFKRVVKKEEKLEEEIKEEKSELEALKAKYQDKVSKPL